MPIQNLVTHIQKAKSADEAVALFSAQAASSGLGEQWIRSIFNKERLRHLPVLDVSFDVHSQGVNVLTYLGIPAETQTQMWTKWPSLPEDVRAAWVEDFKLLDTNDPQDVASYAMLLVGLLTT